MNRIDIICVTCDGSRQDEIEKPEEMEMELDNRGVWNRLIYKISIIHTKRQMAKKRQMFIVRCFGKTAHLSFMAIKHSELK